MTNRIGFLYGYLHNVVLRGLRFRRHVFLARARQTGKLLAVRMTSRWLVVVGVLGVLGLVSTSAVWSPQQIQLMWTFGVISLLYRAGRVWYRMDSR